MEAKKVLVKQGDVAVLSCPFCRKIKKISVAQYKGTGKRELRIKCSCEKKFCLCLEYRRHPRKRVRLLGKNINMSKQEGQQIIIENISMGGIGFTIFNKHRTQTDDQVEVSFELDDSNNTPINSGATVRSLSKDHVGCEFNATHNFKASLGFYLLN